VIPRSNVKHLMLRHDVVDAVVADRFHIYAVDTVDEAVSLLTGVDAGSLDEHMQYPSGSVNQRVAARLDELFEIRQQVLQKSKEDKES